MDRLENRGEVEGRHDEEVRSCDVDAVCDGGLVTRRKMVCAAVKVKFPRVEQGPILLLLFCSGFIVFSLSKLEYTPFVVSFHVSPKSVDP